MLKWKHLRRQVQSLLLARDYAASLLYDWRRGIRTTRTEPLASLHLTHPENLAHANPYSPSWPDEIRAALEALEVNFREYAFVDYGCGKGRVLVEAARHPFRAVLGIDFARELCDASLANLERTRAERKCGSVHVYHADATEFELPPMPCVVYINNSFRDPVLTAALERIRASVERQPRQVRIAYVTPLEAASFARVRGIRVFRSLPRCIFYDLGEPPPR